MSEASKKSIKHNRVLLVGLVVALTTLCLALITYISLPKIKYALANDYERCQTKLKDKNSLNYFCDPNNQLVYSPCDFDYFPKIELRKTSDGGTLSHIPTYERLYNGKVIPKDFSDQQIINLINGRNCFETPSIRISK